MQIRASKSILLILLYLSYPISVAAETNPTRFSLAISGGASKGAYEAGLIWGMIEVLRQVQNAEHGSPGGEPRPIEIASIAGTSAGGINTLLAAMAWSVKPERDGGFANRIDDNIFRDVWLTPDVNRLLPIEPDSPSTCPTTPCCPAEISSRSPGTQRKMAPAGNVSRRSAVAHRGYGNPDHTGYPLRQWRCREQPALLHPL
jgi:hypothetical protein